MENEIDSSLKHHKELVEKFEKISTAKITDICQSLINSIKNGGCIYICGNGGSAADSQHIAGELIGRFRKERKRGNKKEK